LSFALVQSKSGTATSGTTVTVTLTSSTTAGNCLVVYAGAYQSASAPTVNGVTLGGSAGNFAQAVWDFVGCDAEIWVDQNCAGGQTSVVITFAAGAGSSLGMGAWVEEWSGVALTSPADKNAVNDGTSTSPSSGSTGTLSGANELAGGVIAATQSITGPSSPWTNQSQLTAGGLRLVAGHQVVSATTALTYSGTMSSGAWTAAIVTLKSSTTPVSSSDTGSGADSSGITAPISGTDTGSGADVGVIDQPGTETGSGAESSSVTVSVPGAVLTSAPAVPGQMWPGSIWPGNPVTATTTPGGDTGAGAERATVGVTDSDTGAGADAGSAVLGALGLDTGTGTDAGSITAATILGTDTGTGAESSSITVTLPAATDTGSGADVATVGVTDSDSGTATEFATQAPYVPPPIALWRAPDKLSLTGGTMR
jgi:hypothetical protein